MQLRVLVLFPALFFITSPSREHFDLFDHPVTRLDRSGSLSYSRYKYIRNELPFVLWDSRQTYLEFYRPAVHMMRKLSLKSELNANERLFFAEI